MTLSFTCPSCHTRWPNQSVYATCPECNEPCKSLPTPRVMSPAEARERVRNVKFIRYCAERDERRKAAGLPLPEDLGRLEAREITRQLREPRGLPDV